MSENAKQIDLANFRSRLAAPSAPAEATHGRRYWRSLDELGASTEFKALIHREFPMAASEWIDDDPDGVSRRNFIKVMGASLALAGLATTGCNSRPTEKIVPYVQQPENVVPGRPLFYASAFPFGGFGYGVVVEQHEGRPTKIEGNAEHPASLGAADTFAQASILTMYDPDRSQALVRYGENQGWATFVATVKDYFRYQNPASKSGVRSAPPRVRVLTESVTSPTIAAQLKALSGATTDFAWHAFDPVGRANAREGARLAFGGADVAPIYHTEHAKVIVTLDSNFLVDDAGSVPYSKGYIKNRRVRKDAPTSRVRLYAVESTPTLTGANADHRARVTPQRVAEVARLISEGIAAGPSTAPAEHAHGTGDSADKILPFLIKDLLANRGAGLVVCGEYQPPEVHALVHAINAALGNVGEGKPVTYIKEVEASPAAGLAADSLKRLTADLTAGLVDVLVILGGNPVYSAPADVDFATALAAFSTAHGPDGKAKNLAVHLSLYNNETSAKTQWHVPETHYLEAWGDVRAFDGTAAVVQPLIAPLYSENKSAVELLSTFLTAARPDAAGATTQPATIAAATPATQPAGDGVLPTRMAAVPDTAGPTLRPTPDNGLAGTGYEAVRSVWRDFQVANGGGDFEAFWYEVLLRGVVPNSAKAFAAAAVPAAAPAAAPTTAPAASTGLTVIFRPDPTIWDGQFSNNGWLQELAKPLLRYTWENTILVSANTAVALKLTDEPKSKFGSHKLSEANGKHVELTLNGRTVKGPVWVMPGHPDGAITVHLGYGRTRAGRVGSPDGVGIGFNAYALRTSGSPWTVEKGLGIKVTGESSTMASTQNHQVIDNDDLTRREIMVSGTDVGEIHEHHMAHHGKLKPKLPILNPDDPAASPESLFPDNPDHKGGHVPGFPAWAMVIDQTACLGCNACVIACQAENNIPVVGKDQVIRGREMAWLRIDTYYQGSMTEPDDVFFQPMMCVHCEKAPCEVVCPVGATSHSKEGLNEMTYNRCVGTRYCSNNCPYKVRRFNFLQYTDMHTPVLKMLNNPEVTVRQRGVMEKCTYCVQRINRARIEAKKDNEGRGRPIRDGEVTTACASACPTDALIFGNWADPESRVAKLKQEPAGFHYSVLDELATRPRTTYFARVTNPAEGTEAHHRAHAAHAAGEHGKAGHAATPPGPTGGGEPGGQAVESKH